MRELKLQRSPVRIISLVPSITELLSDLGLENEIVGITKFCVHPENIFRTVSRIGGTKTPDHTKIDLLQPDLIIASKEENKKEDIEILERKYPVWVSDVKTLTHATEMIKELGRITDRESKAEKIIAEINSGFNNLNPLSKIKSLYLIWKNPYMAVGYDTFINDMMQLNGMENVMVNNNRYPTLSIEEIANLHPALVLLSSEPYPFKEKDISELKTLIPDSKFILVDGEYFSWYGSRLIGTPAYFNALNEIISENNYKSADHHFNK